MKVDQPAGRRGSGPGDRLQQRLTPFQHRAFGGCHLNRRIDQLVAAAGLELTRMDTYYMKGPRALGYTFEGVAIKAWTAGRPAPCGLFGIGLAQLTRSTVRHRTVRAGGKWTR
jgi:hypothetical protein